MAKVDLDKLKISTIDDINYFIDLVKRTSDVDLESRPKTELEVQQMKLDIPIVMLKHNKVNLKIDLEIIDLEDEYEETYVKIYQEWKHGVVKGRKLDRFYEDREIKNLVPKDEDLRLIQKKIKILNALKKFVGNTLDEMKTKSFALNNYQPIDLYDH